MTETRGTKYGRFTAKFLQYVIDTIPEDIRDEYRNRVLNELKKYSFEPRKKGQPVTSGCVWELSGIDDLDMNNPESFAKYVKEGIHLMYQKGTARRVLNSLLDHLEY